MAGVADGVAVAAQGTIAAARPWLEISATTPWTLTGTVAADLVPAELAALLGGELGLSLNPSAADPVRLGVTRGSEGWLFHANGPFAVTSRGVPFVAGRIGAVSMAFDGAGWPTGIVIEWLAATVRAVEVAGATITEATFNLDAAGSPRDWTGTIDVAAVLDPRLPDGIAAGALGFAGSAEIDVVAGVLALRGQDCVTATADRVTAYGFAADGPLDLCFRDLALGVDAAHGRGAVRDRRDHGDGGRAPRGQRRVRVDRPGPRPRDGRGPGRRRADHRDGDDRRSHGRAGDRHRGHP